VTATNRRPTQLINRQDPVVIQRDESVNRVLHCWHTTAANRSDEERSPTGADEPSSSRRCEDESVCGLVGSHFSRCGRAEAPTPRRQSDPTLQQLIATRGDGCSGARTTATVREYACTPRRPRKQRHRVGRLARASSSTGPRRRAWRPRSPHHDDVPMSGSMTMRAHPRVTAASTPPTGAMTEFVVVVRPATR